jgi:hypothetical protein
LEASRLESREEAARQMMSADIHVAAALDVEAVTSGGDPRGGFVALNVSFITALYCSL